MPLDLLAQAEPWSGASKWSRLLGLAVGLALWHQLTAGNTSDRTRGMLQGLILVISLGIFAAAVNI